MKFEIVGFKNSNPDHSKEITMMNELGQKIIHDHHQIPVIGIIPVFFQFLYLVQFEMTVRSCRFMLFIPQIVFILSFRKIFIRYKIVSEIAKRRFNNLIHEIYSTVTLLARLRGLSTSNPLAIPR